MLPEIKMGETKSVRISVEIVNEKGEEKVGSKLVKSCIDGLAYLAGGRCQPLDAVVKDWKWGGVSDRQDHSL